MASKKQKLPNLKICVDNTESTDESDDGLKSSDSSQSDEEILHKPTRSKHKLDIEDGEVGEDDEQTVLSISSEAPTERRFLSSRGGVLPRSGDVQYGVSYCSFIVII